MCAMRSLQRFMIKNHRTVISKPSASIPLKINVMTQPQHRTISIYTSFYIINTMSYKLTYIPLLLKRAGMVRVKTTTYTPLIPTLSLKGEGASTCVDTHDTEHRLGFGIPFKKAMYALVVEKTPTTSSRQGLPGSRPQGCEAYRHPWPLGPGSPCRGNANY